MIKLFAINPSVAANNQEILKVYIEIKKLIQKIPQFLLEKFVNLVVNQKVIDHRQIR